jgi:hypothetical protein
MKQDIRLLVTQLAGSINELDDPLIDIISPGDIFMNADVEAVW